MNASDKDTIAAIATAPGEGAIGIVRLSGLRAISIADSVFFSSSPLVQASPRTLTYGCIRIQGQNLDQVLASVMPGPHSFTGEDTVEFNCHGGPFLLRRILDGILQEGARHAERGEFTKRAFLNGKLDLSQAEAVADMISARSDLSLQSAFFQLRGDLFTRFQSLSESLRQAATLLEADLDFSEDVAIDLDLVETPIKHGVQLIDQLIQSYAKGKVIRDGALVTLAGRPNVGKSSLMNCLLEQDRSIVTDIPGTTRDTIEEQIDLDGVAVTLVDTAGIRDTVDPIEQEGTRRSNQYIHRAAVVLYIADKSLPPCAHDLKYLNQFETGFLILNKNDLDSHPEWAYTDSPHPTLSISARTGRGVDKLRTSLREILLGHDDLPSEIVTHERHLHALKQAHHGLSQALSSLLVRQHGELIALDLRIALDALADIVGETTPDDVLDQIFKTFCIGK